MSRELDYRENAAETFELANRASTMPDKGRLLRLADRWLDLADRAQRLANHLDSVSSEHPLIRQKLGSSERNV